MCLGNLLLACPPAFVQLPLPGPPPKLQGEHSLGHHIEPSHTWAPPPGHLQEAETDLCPGHSQSAATFRGGVPSPWSTDWSRSQPVRNRAAEQELSGRRASKASRAIPHLSLHSHYRLTPSPHCLPMEKLPPMKPVPGAKKAGDRGVTGPVEGEGEGSQVKYGTACI